MNEIHGSAGAAVDQDRLIVQQFAQNAAKEDVFQLLVEDDDSSPTSQNATFVIKNEDHTLGNALRYVIMRNPDVDFCGYSMPHPSEAKIHIRIQTKGPAAIDILKAALIDLKAMSEHLTSLFTNEFNAFKYNRQDYAYPIDLPYFVERTVVGKRLPVYTDIKSGGTRVVTIIKRIFGNIDQLMHDLKAEIPKIDASVRKDVFQIRVKGRMTNPVMQFLQRKGF